MKPLILVEKFKFHSEDNPGDWLSMEALESVKSLCKEKKKPERDFSPGWTYFVHHGIHPPLFVVLS